MARKLFKRWMPDPHSVRSKPSLRFLGYLMHDPNLFHLNRHSVSVAVFVGLFVAFLPTLGQMPIAALLALLFRCNLPIAVALVWVSNPVTMAPIFFGTYEIGRWILDAPHVKFTLDISWTWFKQDFLIIWKPLVIGSVLSGIVVGCLGYLFMQTFWYYTVMRNWEKRAESRRIAKEERKKQKEAANKESTANTHVQNQRKSA